METKVNYTVVGLFIIVLGAVIVGLVLWLAAGAHYTQYDSYLVYTSESVSGLTVNGPVRYRGVDVGRVTTMEVDPTNPEQVKLTLKIEHGTPLRQNTRAVLAIQGITGLLYVELTGGTRDSPPIKVPEDGSLPEIQSGPSLVTRLDKAFTTLVAQFTGLSARLNVLMSDENQAAVRGTLANLNTITAAVAAHADSIGKGLDSAALTLQDSVRISAELTALLSRANAGIAAVERTARAITQTSQGINTAVKEGRQDLKQLTQSTVPEVSALLNELRQLTDTIQRFGEELERNPRALLFGRQSSQPGPGE